MLGEQTARYRQVRREIEGGVLSMASSLDGRTFTFQAPVAAPLTVGGYVALETGDGTVLGQLLDRSLVRREGPELAAALDADSRIASRIVVTLSAGSGVLLDPSGPFHEAPLRAASGDEVAAWLEARRPDRAVLEVGEAVATVGVPAWLDAGGFDRHTFLCGQSGSGKTYSLGVVLEQLLLATTLPIVVLDPNSDFVRLGAPREGADPEAAARWRDEVAAGVAVRRVDAAGDTRLRLRMPELGPDAQAAVLRLDPIGDREEYAVLLELLEESEDGRVRADLVAALSASERSDARALGQRLKSLRVTQWGVWAREQPGPTLLDELDARDFRCLVVDLGTLGTAEEKALVAEAVLERLWARRGERRPVLVVIDEAHNVCPADPQDRLTELATEHAVRIAAEGRKYGLYLLVSTQRPQKVPENVLSQCDNLLCMRMNAAADVERLAAVFAYAPASVLRETVSFRQGESLAAGKIVPSPLLLRFGRRVSEEGGSDVPATWAERRD